MNIYFYLPQRTKLATALLAVVVVLVIVELLANYVV